MEATCPAGCTIRIELGRYARFPKQTCSDCSLRAQCTTAKDSGRLRGGRLAFGLTKRVPRAANAYDVERVWSIAWPTWRVAKAVGLATVASVGTSSTLAEPQPSRTSRSFSARSGPKIRAVSNGLMS